MQEVNNFTCVYHSVLFFRSKKSQIELQNIPINHSANIDYGDFVKIYKKCTSEPYSFIAFDTTLQTRI